MATNSGKPVVFIDGLPENEKFWTQCVSCKCTLRMKDPGYLVAPEDLIICVPCAKKLGHVW